MTEQQTFENHALEKLGICVDALEKIAKLAMRPVPHGYFDVFCEAVTVAELALRETK